MDSGNFKPITRDIIESYTRTNYRIVGRFKHTSYKPCHWLEQKLLTGRDNRNCYKGYWGIKSETCIQNSPSYPFCNHNCVFCWRDPSGNVDTKFTAEPDDPEYLIGELIRQHNNIIEHVFPIEKSLKNYEIMNEILNFYIKNIKYGLPCQKTKGKYPQYSINDFRKHIKESKTALNNAILLLKNTKVIKTDDLDHYYLADEANSCLTQEQSSEKILDLFTTSIEDINSVYESAKNPRHAAISLDGEPTLYPYIGEFVDGFRSKGFTTFIVSNGTNPNVIKSLEEKGSLPSILYVTLPAPTYEDYKKISRPRNKGLWEKIQDTLNLLADLKTRTVLRITSVQNLNIQDNMIEKYAEIISKSAPDFLDIKGFTLEGESMNISSRLNSDKPGSYYRPDFKYLMDFAQKLANVGNFEIIETHKKSSDILIRVNWPKNKSILLSKDEI